MKYVIVEKGTGGFLPTDTGVRGWLSEACRIVEADSPREALDQVMGKTSQFKLEYGIRWQVFELGPHCTTWTAAPRDGLVGQEIVAREFVT